MGRAGLDQAAGRILDRTSNNEPNNKQNTSAAGWKQDGLSHPISGLPEIGTIRCPSRLQPTWIAKPIIFWRKK